MKHLRGSHSLIIDKLNRKRFTKLKSVKEVYVYSCIDCCSVYAGGTINENTVTAVDELQRIIRKLSSEYDLVLSDYVDDRKH